MVREYDRSEIPAVYNLRDIPPARDEEHRKQSVFRGIDHMIGFTVFEPEREGSEPHTHAYEQANILLEGKLDFVVDGERLTLEEYDTLMIPPGIEHCTRTVSDEPAVLLAFWPLREDFAQYTAYQTEFPTP